jgi:hypothetical protein
MTRNLAGLAAMAGAAMSWWKRSGGDREPNVVGAPTSIALPSDPKPPDQSSWLQLPTINPGAPVDVVGESYHQAELEMIGGGRTPNGLPRRLVTATLVREPDNPYDANAVRVDIAGLVVGHLSREDAPTFHAIIDRLAKGNRAATCRAVLAGGWNRGGEDVGAIGVQLRIGRRPTPWNGRAAFLPSTPWHETLRVALRPDMKPPRDKAVATLVDRHEGRLGVVVEDVGIGFVMQRPDLVAFVQRVRAVGLPTTAELRLRQGAVVLELADPDTVGPAFAALPVGDLRLLRRRIAVTGRWTCARCNSLWIDRRPCARGWFDLDDVDGEPHECPQCGSTSMTHPW